MKSTARVLFFVSVLGTALALVAPLLFGGASYQEAQPAVILGLIATFVFLAAGLPAAKITTPGEDMFEKRLARRNAGLFRSVVAFLVVGLGSAIEFAVSYDELESIRGSAHVTNHYRLDDVAAGSWTGVIGLVATGVALLVVLVFASSKPKRPVAPQQPVQAWYPQQQYAHQPNGQQPYPQQYAQQPYGQLPNS